MVLRACVCVRVRCFHASTCLYVYLCPLLSNKFGKQGTNFCYALREHLSIGGNPTFMLFNFILSVIPTWCHSSC
jgi:hypothetical protein